MQFYSSGVRRHRQRNWKPLTIFAVVVLAACAGEVPDSAQQAKDNKNASANQVLRVAELTADSGDVASAAGLFERAHRLAPNEIAPLLGIGKTANATRRYSIAAEAFRKALEIEPKNAAARRGYGRALIAVNQPEKAVEQYEAALEIDKSDVLAYNGLGVALNLMGDPKGAEQQYRDGLQIAPESLLLRNNLALSLAFGGEYSQALKILQQVVFDPRSTIRNRQNLALVYGLAGQMDKAATVSRIDLNEAQVKNNIAYYESLRAMAAKGRAAAILRGASRVETQTESVKPSEPTDPIAEPKPKAVMPPPVELPGPPALVDPADKVQTPIAPPIDDARPIERRQLAANIRPQRKPEIMAEPAPVQVPAKPEAPIAVETKIEAEVNAREAAEAAVDEKPDEIPVTEQRDLKVQGPTEETLESVVTVESVMPEPTSEPIQAVEQSQPEQVSEMAAKPEVLDTTTATQEMPVVINIEPKPSEIDEAPDVTRDSSSVAETIAETPSAIDVSTEENSSPSEAPMPELVTAEPTPEPPVAETPPQQVMETAALRQQSTSTEIVRVQLSSRRSESAARVEWDQLKSDHAALLGDLALTVQPANLGADRIIYRLLAGPFADRDAARALCQGLSEKKVSCRIVSSAP